MITLDVRISGGGPAVFNFSSGTIATVRLVPPGDGSTIGVNVSQLGPSTLCVASDGGQIAIDIVEGSDPVWLLYTIDCTGGGSVSVGFGGSPTVRVNAGSFLGIEYDNGKPAPRQPSDDEY